MSLKPDKIHQGDCLSLFKKLEDGCVDLAFADPPFNIGYEYDEYDDRRSGDDYLAWSKQWMSEVKRVLRPDGTFWLAIGDEYAAELKVMATRDLGLTLRSWVIWFYTFGVHCKQKFTRSHAHLFYFVKNPKRFTFNSLAVRVPSARELVYGDKRADPAGRVPDDTWMMPPVLPPDAAVRDGFALRPQDIPERFPPHSDTWYFSRVAGTFNERSGWHGCQMPEQLLGRIIKACSNNDDLVLDPFGGSGTTLAVAKKLGRSFVGFELSKQYANRIEKRLAAIQVGGALTGPENPALSAPRTKMGRQLVRATSNASVSVTQSPLLARANVSLGQVAVGNGEFATAIAEAFMASHQGYSADRVVADPALNETFLENCRFLRIPGGPSDWNHLLLNVRKQRGLTAIDTSRRTVIHRASMEPFMFASEIAWRKVSELENCSLDEVLCDPELSCRFHTFASQIAPGYSAFEYRWAALSVRKDAKVGDQLLKKVSDTLSPNSTRISEARYLPIAPGHYLVVLGKTPFFVGYAAAIRECAIFGGDRIFRALEVMERSIRRENDLVVRTCVAPKYNEGAWKAARREKLLLENNPVANVPIGRSAA